MNRRGFVRIVEASIAIILIITVLFLFFSRGREVEITDYSERAREILEEISRDSEMRENILDWQSGLPPSSVVNFVGGRIPEVYLEKEVIICNVGDICGLTSYVGEGNVFSAERVISYNIESAPGTVPKKIKLFIWEVE
jgi:hypothetical protein